MFTKSKEKEEKTSKNNKKRNIILIVAGLLLLIVILFLLWFFNRKFEVTFDYNNGTKEEVVYVKYNKTINSKDVKTKEDLGEQFIDWYLILEEKDGKDVLADKPYDFKTKINKNIKLKAVYEGVVETITVTFDSKGGSNVDAITINKGTELTLPKDPTYKGYTFKGWVDVNDRPIYDKALLSEDTTLYAKWKKVEEKKETPKQEKKEVEEKKETPKQEKKEEPTIEVKPEKITLSLSRDTIHYNGIKTAKASAKVENATGDVTYSLSNTLCMGIDAKTGVITAKNNGACSKGAAIKVYAKTPSGTTAEQTIYYEKDLELTSKGESYSKYASFYGDSNGYYVTANQNVTWDVTMTSSVSYEYTYKDFISKTSTSVKGGYTFDTIVASTGAISRVSGDVRLHAKTKAEQKFFVDIKRDIN